MRMFEMICNNYTFGDVLVANYADKAFEVVGHLTDEQIDAWDEASIKWASGDEQGAFAEYLSIVADIAPEVEVVYVYFHFRGILRVNRAECTVTPTTAAKAEYDESIAFVLSVFEKELGAISDPDIYRVTVALLTEVPTYFWEVPASSSGKYHPEYALGEGGLIRHTKAAVRFCVDLKPIAGFTEEEYNYAIAALLLHDSWKQGNFEGRTAFNHPLLAGKYVRINAPEWYAEKVCPLIESHMGQWNTSKWADGVELPLPKTKLQKFVHMCDYLASRKAYLVDFDLPYDEG